MLVRRHHPRRRRRRRRRLEVCADGVDKRNVGDASFSVRRGNSDKGGKGRLVNGRSDMKEKTYNGRQSIVQRERERKDRHIKRKITFVNKVEIEKETMNTKMERKGSTIHG